MEDARFRHIQNTRILSTNKSTKQDDLMSSLRGCLEETADQRPSSENSMLEKLLKNWKLFKSLDSSVGTVLGYGLDDRGFRV
jgi:hypothetical protein